MKRCRIYQVAIVDGTLVPTRDGRPVARSRNYCYSTNLEVAIGTDTRLVIAIGDPQLGDRNDCTVHRDSRIADVFGGRPVVPTAATRAAKA